MLRNTIYVVRSIEFSLPRLLLKSEFLLSFFTTWPNTGFVMFVHFEVLNIKRELCSLQKAPPKDFILYWKPKSMLLSLSNQINPNHSWIWEMILVSKSIACSWNRLTIRLWSQPHILKTYGDLEANYTLSSWVLNICFLPENFFILNLGPSIF